MEYFLLSNCFYQEGMKNLEHIDVYLYNMYMDKIFKALADKNRRIIITLLKNKELSVNELLKYFDITQATLSNHLAILRKAELVNFKVAGKKRIYVLNENNFGRFIAELNKFIGFKEQNKISELIVRYSK